MDKMISSLDAAAGSGSSCFTSTISGYVGLLTDPKLLWYFKDQTAQQPLIATEPRTAREERTLMRRAPTLWDNMNDG